MGHWDMELIWEQCSCPKYILAVSDSSIKYKWQEHIRDLFSMVPLHWSETLLMAGQLGIF